MTLSARLPKDIVHITLIILLTLLGSAILFIGLRPGIPDFNQYQAGEERKLAFFNYLLPLVDRRNAEILETRKQLLKWHARRADLNWLSRRKVQSLAKTYAIEDFDLGNDDHWNILLRRVDIVPPSLALAQAANESGWGTSRFAQQGFNYYGEWCFVKGCGMVPDERPTGAYHEVANFETPQQSVESYIHNLNYHSAYKSLRELREELRNSETPLTGMALTEGLRSYSERGEEYVLELQSMIRFNDLSQYDEGGSD